MLGALAWVAGGGRNGADWGWLTGSRVAQGGGTPLHDAARQGRQLAITTLLAANADIHSKRKVGEGQGGLLEGRRGGGGLGSLF